MENVDTSAKKTHLFDGLGEAFSSVGSITVLGFGLGAIALLMSEVAGERHWYNLPAELFEHVGAGLFVSAIAVFGYEWRSHSRRTIDLSEKLAALLSSHSSAMLDQATAHLVNKLPDAKRVADSCKAVIHAISVLEKREDRVSGRYVGFISALLQQVVAENVSALRDLQVSGRTAKFNVPKNSMGLADRILSAQMKAMDCEERYDVVSDLLSWRPKSLDLFSRASEDALARGIIVRRVFNLSLYKEEVSKIPRQELDSILMHHLELVEKFKGRYLVAVYGAVENLRKEIVFRYNEEDWEELHFGLFRFRDGSWIKYNVEDKDLSKISISRNPEDESSSDLEDFEEVWDKAIPLSSSVARSVGLLFDADRRKADSKSLEKIMSSSLSSKDAAVLGDILTAAIERSVKVLGDQEFSISGRDKYNDFYKRVFADTERIRRIFSVSLATPDYFWQRGKEIVPGSVEEAMRGFISGGGSVERVFLTSAEFAMDEDNVEAEIISRHAKKIGVAAFVRSESDTSPGERRYFIVACGERGEEDPILMAEASLGGDSAVRLFTISCDRDRCAAFLRRYAIIRQGAQRYEVN